MWTGLSGFCGFTGLRTADGSWQHPSSPGGPHISEFLTHLAVQRHVSASTQNQALCALVFLYRQVLELDPGRLDGVRAKGRDGKGEKDRVVPFPERCLEPIRQQIEIKDSGAWRLLKYSGSEIRPSQTTEIHVFKVLQPPGAGSGSQQGNDRSGQTASRGIHFVPSRACPVGAEGSRLNRATNATAAPDGLVPSELKVRS